MLRRDFLKLVGLAATGTAIASAVPWIAAVAATKTVSAGGRLYRSDGSGRVSVSLDDGKTWAVHSDLGSEFAVTDLAVDRSDRLLATVGYRAWSFELLLAPNLVSWLTA